MKYLRGKFSSWESLLNVLHSSEPDILIWKKSKNPTVIAIHFSLFQNQNKPRN